jgi:protocatechuate 3,4-dioxygenase alpha subunit
MSERPGLIATSSQTVGPFFHFGLTANDRLGVMASPGMPGEHIQLRVCVRDGAGEPVPDAIIELYQADGDGRYPDSPALERPPANPEPRVPSPEPRAPSLESRAPASFTGFGRLPTGADGCCVFATIKPGTVRVNATEQAPHINVCLLSRGLLRQIYTRIYFKDDPLLASDPLMTLVPEERRVTLIAEPSASEAGVWDFVIRMQGPGETVFFDL